MQTKPTIYMIGTTHFDPVWMWTWDEAMASIRSTFRSALDRMNEDARFIYSFSCPPVFEWIKNVDPRLFEEIRKRVREGRWELVEGWWVQPDCNLACGESYVRQSLYGQRYLMENFGTRARAGFNTDSFGHSLMLPQIYRQSGMDVCVFGRPTPGEKDLPGPMFVWESPDGSSVLAFRSGSDGANAYSKDVAASLAELGEGLGAVGHDMLMLYGVSNHGGAPTRQAIRDINAAIEDDSLPYRVKFSSMAAFSDEQKRRGLPVVRDELQVKAFGVFVNHAETKANNRRCEYALLNAERFALLASLMRKREYPAGELTVAWKDTLFNQFHDILGGASVKNAYFDARNLHGRALQTAGEVLHYSLQSISKDIDTSGEGFPVVVWNPNAFSVETGIEAELQWPWEFDWYDGPLTVTDAGGSPIPCQIVQECSAIPRFRSRFVFRDTIGPAGYKVFYVHWKEQPAEFSEPMGGSETQVESARYIVKIDPRHGGIASIYDKTLGRAVMNDCARPVALEDKGDIWCFNVDGYGPEAGTFRVESVEVVEDGPVRALVRVKSRLGESLLEQDIILYRDGDMIEGRFRVDWRGKRQALKLCFDAAIPEPVVTSSVPYGSIRRPRAEVELPTGEWLDLAGDGFGVSLLTDSVFAYDMQGSAARLTLLRSPIYAHYGHPALRRQIDESLDYEYLDQGRREGAWAILVHGGDWRAAEVPKRAAAFNNPPITIDESNHPGDLPPQDSLLSTESGSSLLTVSKRAEDDDSLVLRAFEYAGRADELDVFVKPLGRRLSVKLAKHEIKTIKLARSAEGEAAETNLLEERE